MTLKPTPPKIPENEKITYRDWLPIALIVIIIIICACGG